MSRRLAAVVVLGLRRGLAPRGEHVGSQLRRKFPSEAAAAAATAVAATGVAGARRQKPRDDRPSKTTAGSARLFIAAEVAERAAEERLEDRKVSTRIHNTTKDECARWKAERRKKTYPEAPIAAPAAHTPRPFRGRAVLPGMHRLEPAVGVSRRLAPVRVHDDFGTTVAANLVGDAVGVLIARGGGAAADGGGFGWRLPLRRARRQLDKVVLPGRGVPLGDPARGKGRGAKGRPVAAGGGGACHGWWWNALNEVRSVGAVGLFLKEEMVGNWRDFIAAARLSQLASPLCRSDKWEGLP